MADYSQMSDHDLNVEISLWLTYTRGESVPLMDYADDDGTALELMQLMPPGTILYYDNGDDVWCVDDDTGGACAKRASRAICEAFMLSRKDVLS